MREWWETYFDEDYVRLWSMMRGGGNPERQVESLWTLLGLTEGAAVLDAPCGYGRIARVLADKGARVLGIDASEPVLLEAERRRGDLPAERLTYRRHDLRKPFDASGFDAAVCLYTSLGYGSEDDDRRILTGLRMAVRPVGIVFVEAAHREAVAARTGAGRASERCLADGTRLVAERRLNASTGRLESVRSWTGPAGSGVKVSSLRVYTADELSALVCSAGLVVRSRHDGCSPRPFIRRGRRMSRRLGLLAVSP
jgi:SAM-dependent methyltransferase